MSRIGRMIDQALATIPPIEQLEKNQTDQVKEALSYTKMMKPFEISDITRIRRATVRRILGELVLSGVAQRLDQNNYILVK